MPFSDCAGAEPEGNRDKSQSHQIPRELNSLLETKSSTAITTARPRRDFPDGERCLNGQPSTHRNEGRKEHKAFYGSPGGHKDLGVVIRVSGGASFSHSPACSAALQLSHSRKAVFSFHVHTQCVPRDSLSQ